jgi:hypothetical protein
MHALWHFILYVLACWSHDPATLNAERARCAGAVVVAYAALAVEPPAPPAPRREEIGKKNAPEFPTEPTPCPQCHDTGRIYRSDGGYVRCPCGACSTGRCKTPSSLP